jgi:hypothetical protein
MFVGRSGRASPQLQSWNQNVRAPESVEYATSAPPCRTCWESALPGSDPKVDPRLYSPAADTDATICSNRSLPGNQQACRPVVSNFSSSEAPSMECETNALPQDCEKVLPSACNQSVPVATYADFLNIYGCAQQTLKQLCAHIRRSSVTLVIPQR